MSKPTLQQLFRELQAACRELFDIMCETLRFNRAVAELDQVLKTKAKKKTKK